MPRIRAIKPEFFDDPSIGQLSPLAALFFIGLWTQADRSGRLLEEPSRLKHRLCPYWPSEAEPLISELIEGGFVIRYRDGDGRNLLQIRCFEKHQRPHPKEASSAYPGPAVKKPGKPRRNTASRVDLGSGDLGSGKGRSTYSASASPPLDRADVPTDDDTSITPVKAQIVQAIVRASTADGFEAFWAAYPRKVGKGAARSEWQKLHPSAALQAAIRAALAQQTTSDQWRKEGGQFIPHARTWLHQRRWEDEPDNLEPSSVGQTPKTARNLAALERFAVRRTT